MGVVHWGRVLHYNNVWSQDLALNPYKFPFGKFRKSGKILEPPAGVEPATC
jgi:hypothetical protein